MVNHIEKWAINQNLLHFGSDREKNDDVSLTAHKTPGFHIIDETEDEFIVLKKLI